MKDTSIWLDLSGQELEVRPLENQRFALRVVEGHLDRDLAFHGTLVHVIVTEEQLRKVTEALPQEVKAA